MPYPILKDGGEYIPTASPPKLQGGTNASGEAFYALDKDLKTKSDDATLAEEKQQ